MDKRILLPAAKRKKLPRKVGRKPLGDSKRVTLSVVMARDTAAFVRHVAKESDLTMGQGAEYLILLGAQHLAMLGGKEPLSYHDLLGQEFGLT